VFEEENCAGGIDGCEADTDNFAVDQFDFSCAMKKDADDAVEGNSCSDVDGNGRSREICSAAKSIAKAEFAEKQAGKSCIEEANCKDVNGQKCMTGAHSGGANPGKYYCELKEFTEGELTGESAETNSACTDVRGDGTAGDPFRSYELCGAYAAEQAAIKHNSYDLNGSPAVPSPLTSVHAEFVSADSPVNSPSVNSFNSQ
jgi:hypothetical protein